MLINRLLKEGKLRQPEDAERQKRAYIYTLRLLHLVDRNDPPAEFIAKKVIEIEATGIRDPLK